MTPHQEIDRALCRSAVYTALALGLGEPDDEVVERVASAQGTEQLAAALDALETEVAFDPPHPTLDELGPRYDELFGHTSRGEVAPFETAWGAEGGPFVQPRELADLGGFYSAFGVDSIVYRRGDHAQCECEFMALLATKEAYAIDADDPEMRKLTRGAERLFLRDHLGRFAPALGIRLSQVDPAGFYGALGGVLASFVTDDCRRFDVTAGPDDLALRVSLDDGAPVECGTACEDCPT